MKHSYSRNAEQDDDEQSNLMGINSSYIHHIQKERQSHGSSGSDGLTSDTLARHLERTASQDYEYHGGGDRFSGSNTSNKISSHSRSNNNNKNSSSSHSRSKQHTKSTARPSSSTQGTRRSNATSTLEENYTQAMNRATQGGYFGEQKDLHEYETPEERLQQEMRLSSHTRSSHNNSKRSTRSSKTSGSGKTTASLKITKKPLSTNDPSEETIAVFGAFGVTGNYFLQLAMEAGYRVRALILPGMTMDDFADSESIKLITGSFDEPSVIQRVCKNADYVVCLLNDCDKTLQEKKQQQNADTCSVDLENMPPVLYDTSNTTSNGSGNRMSSGSLDKKSSSATSTNANYQFMQLLLPILEELDTCRVLLYQASAVTRDDKGTTPIFGKVVKKLAVKKNWRQALKEQDKIVKYISQKTKQTSMNFIVTRPSNDMMIRNRPSRKKLSASKSQPGPFPITNVDLAEFTLSALRMEKIFNSCPYVVQDGI